MLITVFSFIVFKNIRWFDEVRSYAKLRKRSECKYQPVLLAPGWVTIRFLSNKSLPNIQHVFKATVAPTQYLANNLSSWSLILIMKKKYQMTSYVYIVYPHVILLYFDLVYGLWIIMRRIASRMRMSNTQFRESSLILANFFLYWYYTLWLHP